MCVGKVQSHLTWRILLSVRRRGWEKKESEERLKYDEENKERINRRPREKRQKVKELKSAQHAVLEGDTNDDRAVLTQRQKWVLY